MHGEHLRLFATVRLSNCLFACLTPRVYKPPIKQSIHQTIMASSVHHMHCVVLSVYLLTALLVHVHLHMVGSFPLHPRKISAGGVAPVEAPGVPSSANARTQQTCRTRSEPSLFGKHGFIGRHDAPSKQWDPARRQREWLWQKRPGRMASTGRATEGRGASRDCYEVLGVPRSAGDAEVRAAYRRLALLTHPDKGGSEAAFQEVNAAFDALSSAERRRSYDGAHAAGPPAPSVSAEGRRERALRRLERAVAQAPREQRQAALASLPGDVARELLAWMERRRGVRAETSLAPSAGVRAGATSSPPRRCSGEDLDEELIGEGEACTSTLAVLPSDSCLPGGARANHGIKRAGGSSKLYMVHMCFLNLLAVSRPAPLEAALRFRIALSLLKEAICARQASLEQLGPEELSGLFSDVAKAACATAGVQPEELRLSLTPWVSAVSEVGFKIYGRRTQDVPSAMAQRAVLLRAKAEGWPSLRKAWLGLLCETRSLAEAEAIATAAYAAQEPRRAVALARGRALSDPCEAGSAWEGGRSRLAAAAAEVAKALAAEAVALERPAKRARGSDMGAAERASGRGRRILAGAR